MTERVLRPAIDDFRIDTTDSGTTRLVGDIRDASLLNRLLAHFAAMNIDVVGLRRIEPALDAVDDTRSNDPNSPETGTES